MGLKDVLEISVCHDLGELCDYRYFYEGLIQFTVEQTKRQLADEITSSDQEITDDALRRSLYLLGGKRPS
jgi:hypothetical protein